MAQALATSGELAFLQNESAQHQSFHYEKPDAQAIARDSVENITVEFSSILAAQGTNPKKVAKKRNSRPKKPKKKNASTSDLELSKLQGAATHKVLGEPHQPNIGEPPQPNRAESYQPNRLEQRHSHRGEHHPNRGELYQPYRGETYPPNQGESRQVNRGESRQPNRGDLHHPNQREPHQPNRREPHQPNRGESQPNRVMFLSPKHHPQTQHYRGLGIPPASLKPNSPTIVMSKNLKFIFHQNMIEKLKKKCGKHPQAEFMCKLCSYYCDTEMVVEKHVADKRHMEAMKEHLTKCTITYMPRSLRGQFEVLSRLVENQARVHSLTKEDCHQRQRIADDVDAIVQHNLPGCSARLYGSSLNGFGTRSSDVNIYFVVPNDKSPSKYLLQLSDLLVADNRFEDVKCDLSADLPGIRFNDKNTRLKCLVCLNSKNAYEISRLLAQYEAIDGRVKTLAAVFRTWAAICSLNIAELGAWPSYAFDLLLVYYLQQIPDPVLPVLHELVDDPNPSTPEHYLDAACLGNKWKCENTSSIGKLWLNLFGFYARDFANTEKVVCISQLEPLKRSVKKWPGRKIAIEDPFTPKRNVSRSIVNIVTFDYILYCFCTTYKYYANLQTKSGPIFGAIQMPCQEPELEEISKTSNNNREVEMILRTDPLYTKQPFKGVPKNYEYLTILPEKAALLFKFFNTENLCYEFNKAVFTKNKVLPVVCCICQQEGHTKTTCKAEKLPPLQELPPMTQEFIGHVSNLCEEMFELLLPSKEETKQREDVVQAIQDYLLQFIPQAQLELFGSSKNGFGLQKSDLDICLTLKDNPSDDVRNFPNIFDELFNQLRKNDNLQNVIAITTAKVPIIKFFHVQSKLEGDISVYNTLAQRNTKMLRAYSEIDQRVKIMGFMFKRFAKLCDICDASRGSLSSYAYTLMAIYFLQRCDPPLVPVLQELQSPSKPRENVIVEGCDTYFFDDLENLEYVWPGYKKNTMPVGELWLQLLCFYTEKFDFKADVIAIRQLGTLHRFEKLWNSKSIAIEDPFDLNHNLGAGLSRRMHIFIVNALRRGRKLFGTPVNLDPDRPLQEYFFDLSRLVVGVPPRDRCCKYCNKIGHMVKDCPVKKQEQKKEQDEVIAGEKDMHVNRRGNRLHNRGLNENSRRGSGSQSRAQGGLTRNDQHYADRQKNSMPFMPWSQRQFLPGPSSHHAQLEELRALGCGSRQQMEMPHYNVTLSCAPNWKPPSDMQQLKPRTKHPGIAEPLLPPQNFNSYSEPDRSRTGTHKEDNIRFSPGRVSDVPRYQFTPQVYK